MGKNQEVYVAELHTHLPCYAHAFQEPRGQKITIFADAQAALQRIASDTPGPGQRYALAIAQQAHDLWEQRRVSVQFRWVPSHAGTTGNEKADEWAKMAARNERGSEQLPYHVPGPPEARYHQAEVGRGMLMDGVALEQAPRVPTTEEDAARPNAGQS